MSNKFLNNLAKIIIILVIIAGIIFAFNIFSNAEDTSDITKKTEEEVKYLDTKLLSLINNLNNIDLQNYKIVITKVNEESASNGNSSQKQGAESEDSSENGTNNEEKTLSKMEQETIVSEDKNIDWSTIEGELEMLCATWPTIILDLSRNRCKL